MRCIEFRGKTKDGKWVYGDLVHSENGFVIRQKYCYCKDDEDRWYTTIRNEVEKSTIGQYTGVEDSCGNKIFEGDIYSMMSCSSRSDMPYKSDNYVVEYINGGFWIRNKRRRFAMGAHCAGSVIGNIYDNPELME